MFLIHSPDDGSSSMSFGRRKGKVVVDTWVVVVLATTVEVLWSSGVEVGADEVCGVLLVDPFSII